MHNSISTTSRHACSISAPVGHVGPVSHGRPIGHGARFRVLGALVAAAVLAAVMPASGAGLDRMGLDRWKKLREAERYQLTVAETYYTKKEWKIAAAEYEKYLTLYEQSEAAGFSQLKWAMCQVNLRHPNTAIKEGFQTVIDYWPDTPDAIVAAYKIGETYKGMGDIAKAKKAFWQVVEQHPDHLVAAYALRELVDIATIESDSEQRVALQKKLTFDFKRQEGEIATLCEAASRQLAQYYCHSGSVADAVKALATTYDEDDLPAQVFGIGKGAVANLTRNEKSREKGYELADAAIAYIRGQTPTDLADEQNKARAKRHWYAIAELQSKAGRAAEVPKVYEQMITMFGADDGLLGRLAGWYKEQDDLVRARETFARFADKVEGQSQVAKCLRQEGSTDQAVGIYRRLAAEDSDHVIHWTSEVATTYRDAKRFKEAIEVFKELMALDGANENSWRYAMGSAYQRVGQPKEAIACFRLCTNAPDNMMRLAECHSSLKEWDEAIIMYNQVMGVSPKHTSWALMRIAKTQEAAGQPERAIRTYQAICDKHAGSSEASAAHVHLKKKYKITATLGGATQGAEK